jgi:hypothetical protein
VVGGAGTVVVDVVDVVDVVVDVVVEVEDVVVVDAVDDEVVDAVDGDPGIGAAGARSALLPCVITAFARGRTAACSVGSRRPRSDSSAAVELLICAVLPSLIACCTSSIARRVLLIATASADDVSC